jgi:dephospho-CoA kinase
MLQIGITGGIGAGKSLVASVFNLLEVPVYNADERAKWLMNSDPNLKKAIVQLFGKDSYKNNQLNRSYLAEKVFPHADQLKKLNETVHPAVGKDYRRWVEIQIQNSSSYCMKEAALMFETASYRQLDYTLLIHANEEIRMKRVMNRDPDRSKKQINAIMQKQMPEKNKLMLADYIIDNNGDKMLLPQILKLHDVFISLQNKNKA